jgi:hypothetical protein
MFDDADADQACEDERRAERLVEICDDEQLARHKPAAMYEVIAVEIAKRNLEERRRQAARTKGGDS